MDRPLAVKRREEQEGGAEDEWPPGDRRQLPGSNDGDPQHHRGGEREERVRIHALLLGARAEMY